MDIEKIKGFIAAHKAELACFAIGLLAGELRTYRKIAKGLKRTVMSLNE